jgi:phenylpyruvate tautomerase PptA (4-oxalocrotonate tautomerase family)
VPLVRIEVQQGRSSTELLRLADVVQEVMRDVFAAPPGDRYQVVTEHPVGHVIAEDSGLGFRRSEDVVVLQIFHQGRSVQQKTAAYEQLALRLEKECGLSPSDLVVSMVENERSDWSFGEGRAQFLTGEL